jgi:putative hydrolase of the HAD superfamily
VVPVRAITFDFWNTLVRANDDQAQWRRDAWLKRLDEAGLPTDADIVREAFYAEWLEHQKSWQSGVIYDGEKAADAAVRRVCEATGYSLPNDVRDDLVHLFLTEGENAEFQLCPGVIEAVPTLAAAGVRLGIVCDVGFTPSSGLRRLLDRFGLLQYFTGWSFSDEVRCYKPDPRIFEHALSYLDVAPADAAHIGDIRRTDVAGARAVGMTAVRYRAVNDDTDDAHPEGDHVIDRHDELLSLLALA